MVLLRAVGAYTRALVVAPVPTKALTAAVVAATGDAFAQRADPTAAQYDVGRAATFASFGALYTGAFQHALFGWLDAHCHGAALASLVERYVLLDFHWLRAIEMTLCNQLCIVPFLYLPLFFAVSGIARGLNVRAAFTEAVRKYLPLLHRNWLFWLPVQTVFFAVLAPEFLVPITCMAGVVWNLILSSLAYRGVHAPAATVSAAATVPPATTATAVATVPPATTATAVATVPAATTATADPGTHEPGNASAVTAPDNGGGEAQTALGAPRRLTAADSAALCVLISCAGRRV